MAEYKLPEQVVGMVGEWEKGTDVTRILWKHRQAVQGCYTHKLKVRDARAMLMHAAVRPDTDEPYGRDCPLEGCCEWHGTFRHVQMGCKEERMVRLKEKLWDFVEEVLKTHETVGHWLQAAATSRVEGGCGHPEGWTGEEEFQERWPILHAVGWLVPTTHERDF